MVELRSIQVFDITFKEYATVTRILEIGNGLAIVTGFQKIWIGRAKVNLGSQMVCYSYAAVTGYPGIDISRSEGRYRFLFFLS